MKEKQCIFCQKDFIEVSAEHVIPKSIGGQFTIHSVCKQCNSLLNKTIDEPFKNNKLIATYRRVYSTKGRGKNISDPFKGEYINMDGNEYSLQLTDDFTVSLKMKPKFPKKSDIKIGEAFQIEIDKKSEDLVNVFRERVANDLNVPIEEVQITNIIETHRPETTRTFKVENNSILLEFSKIFFQTASYIFEGTFLQDSTAEKYRSMLLSGKIDPSMEHLISPRQPFLDEILAQLLIRDQFLDKKHLVILLGIEGVGLVGFLKIYNLNQIQILSPSSIFYSSGMTIVVNDFENKSLEILYSNRLMSCNIGINEKYIQNEKFTKNLPELDYPILNKNGDTIAKNLIELTEDLKYPRSLSTDFRSSLNITLFFNDEIFIKPKSLNIALPIESITYNYSFTTIKSRC
ncbi:hypothetical protein D3C87_40050 [compost metagenome]